MFSTSSWKIWILWVTFGTFLTTFFLLNQLQKPFKPFYVQNEFFYYDIDKEEPLSTNQKCLLPRVHPFDPSILKYLTPSKPIRCKERFTTITFIDQNGVLKFNLTALKLCGYEAQKLQCSYKEIVRRNDFKVDFGEPRKILLNGSRVQSEFIYVSCHNFAGIPFYTNVHCHIIPIKPSHINNNGSYYNILVIGIDSLSRLSCIRHLPKTYKFLIKNLNAFIFRGMTKVGDNTFPNLGAILTGKSVFGAELPKVKDPHGTYDEWPYIWKNFSRAGYATFFAEDQPDIGLFTYLRGGLRDQPTDHYMRPFWLVVQTSMLYRFSSNLCFGDTPKHLLQLRYTRDFVAKYSELQRPFFAFSFLVEVSHDYVSQVTSIDRDLESWLRDLLDSGYLNKTFLFFLSDHGHRFDAMRATLIGRIEERMPFLAVVMPETALKTQEDVGINLKINQGRLTTPYDIYYSMLDILANSVGTLKLGSATSFRGTSLFGKIKENRTCETAGIPDHYCICEMEKELQVSDPRSVRVANSVVSSINNMIQFHRNFCSELHLDEILRADLVVPREEVVVNSRIYFGSLLKDKKAEGIIKKLRIVVRTTPGGALFESTLILREDDNSIEVIGDISRINKYGSQSACIDDAVLRKYCFCLHLF